MKNRRLSLMSTVCTRPVWVFDLFVVVLWIILLATVVSSGEAVRPPQYRTINIGGPLPARYMGQVASFGNPLDGSDGNDMRRTYNLVLPTDDLSLCDYPKSFKDLSAQEEAVIRNTSDILYPYPVALFVSINRCSTESMARVAVEIQKRLVKNLELLVIYFPDPRSNKLIELSPDSELANNDNYRSIGIIYIPYQYAAGIETRMQIAWTGEDPRFLRGDNANWFFPFQLSNFTGDYDNDDRYSNDSGSSNGNRGGDAYWFRIVLFSILVLSPCCRACYLWYAGGGRFYFRRNENGRIIGLQYIPPAPAWLSTGRTVGGGGQPRRTEVITEEQFNELPEIDYQPIDSHYDEDRQQEHNEIINTDNSSSNNKDDTAKPASGEAKPETNDPGICLEKEHDSTTRIPDKEDTDEEPGTEKLDSPSKVAGDPETYNSFEEKKAEEASELVRTGQEADKPKEIVRMKKGESKSLADPPSSIIQDPPVNEQQAPDSQMESMERGENVSCQPAEGGDSDNDGDNKNKENAENGSSLICKSTMCSVCIEDFEDGEKIILLPQCQHGFHRECIYPWLTERQGCCPFCKTPVFHKSSEETDEESNENAGGDNASEVMADGDGASRNLRVRARSALALPDVEQQGQERPAEEAGLESQTPSRSRS